MEGIRKEVSDQRKQRFRRKTIGQKNRFRSEVSNQRKWRDPG